MPIDLAGDKYGGARVEVATGYASQEVGRTRPTGRHAYCGHSGNTARGFGRKSGTLFMVHANHTRAPVPVERVEHVRDHASGELEDSGNKLVSQSSGYIVGGFHGDSTILCEEHQGSQQTSSRPPLVDCRRVNVTIAERV